MSLMIDLDCSPEDFQTCDQSSQLEPGFYRAIVNEVYEDHAEPGCYVFKFKITHGPRRNQILTDWLRHPNLAQDTDKAKTMHKRFLGWLKRLGLITAEMAAAGKINCEIESSLGTEVVLKMVVKDQKEKVVDPYGKESWQKTGQRFTNIDYMGVYPLTHYEIPDEMRAELELPPAIIPPEEAAKRARAVAMAAAAPGAKRAAGKKAADAVMAGAGATTPSSTLAASHPATHTAAVPAGSRNYDDL